MRQPMKMHMHMRIWRSGDMSVSREFGTGPIRMIDSDEQISPISRHRFAG
jgi:hypothetical protein